MHGIIAFVELKRRQGIRGTIPCFAFLPVAKHSTINSLLFIKVV